MQLEPSSSNSRKPFDTRKHQNPLKYFITIQQQRVLTLWDRYTRLRGFCLQFSGARINSLVRTEREHRNYASIELVEVRYGINAADPEFKFLAEQICLQALLKVCQVKRDIRVAPDILRMLPPHVLALRLLRFCCMHKDPFFVDEREIRIFACPLGTAASRPFIGIATQKPIYRRGNAPNAPRYIVLNEDLLPGVTPNRIIIGPQAQLDPHLILALYPGPPKIIKADLPIKR